jgi:hypothetical protein
MRIWLDTEFTDLDKPKLISVGMAAENGEDCYVELAEGQSGCWRRSDCTEFVAHRVLPLLEPPYAFMVQEAGRRVAGFLMRCGADSKGRRVQVHADYKADLYLVRDLLLGTGFGYDSLADWYLAGLGMYGQSVADELMAQSRRHHALDDARAFRAGRLAEEAALRKDFRR